MKTFILLFVSILWFTNSINGAVRTVSNHPTGGAQYNTLQAGLDASSNGDTLLIEGTDIPYFLTNCSGVTKKIVMIGIGFNPGKQSPKRTKISNSCSNLFSINAGATGSRFYGIEFLQFVGITSAIDDWVFEDCQFDISLSFSCVNSSNWAIRNCVFTRTNDVNLDFGCATAVLSGVISNCVFNYYILGSGNTNITLNIEHSIFLTPGPTIFSGLYYAVIEDNIFMNAFPGGVFNCSFENNLCRVPGTFPPQPANGNTASNNIENTDPLFVNCPSGAYFSYAHDYHLQSGSPCVNAGNDGTDIGIHGGFTGFSEQGEVLINPIVRYMNVFNSSVQPNGILQVNVNITKPDNN